MALETMASLSDLLSSLLSSKPPYPSPSPSSLKLITLPSSISASSVQNLAMTTKILTDDNEDVINRVAYPSLANANLVFFKSGYYNVEVVPKDGESEEQLLNDFKRSCFRAGVLQESQEKKKRKTKEAAKKYRKRRPNPKPKPQSTQEIHKSRNVSREEDEEDDHWELPLLRTLRFHIPTGLRSKPESHSGTVMRTISILNHASAFCKATLLSVCTLVPFDVLSSSRVVRIYSLLSVE